MRENVLFFAGWEKPTVPACLLLKGPLRQRCSQLYLPGVEAAYPFECRDAAEEQAAVKVLQVNVSHAAKKDAPLKYFYLGCKMLKRFLCWNWSKDWGLKWSLKIMQYLLYQLCWKKKIASWTMKETGATWVDLLLQYYATWNFLKEILQIVKISHWVEILESVECCNLTSDF